MAFDGQSVKAFDFYIDVNKMFVPSIKTFSKQAERKAQTLAVMCCSRAKQNHFSAAVKNQINSE